MRPSPWTDLLFTVTILDDPDKPGGGGYGDRAAVPGRTTIVLVILLALDSPDTERGNRNRLPLSIQATLGFGSQPTGKECRAQR